jgi:hypothetical protein
MQRLDRSFLVVLLLLCSLSSSVASARSLAQAGEVLCGPHCAVIDADGSDPTARPFFLQALLNESISEIVLTAPRYQVCLKQPAY